jgi:hypothetical protein
MRLYPAAGLQVRDPRTRALIPPEGIEVDETNLAFHRLWLDGDMTTEPVKQTLARSEPAAAADPAPAEPPAAPPTEPVEDAEPAPAASTEAGETE